MLHQTLFFSGLSKRKISYSRQASVKDNLSTSAMFCYVQPQITGRHILGCTFSSHRTTTRPKWTGCLALHANWLCTLRIFCITQRCSVAEKPMWKWFPGGRKLENCCFKSITKKLQPIDLHKGPLPKTLNASKDLQPQKHHFMLRSKARTQ